MDGGADYVYGLRLLPNNHSDRSMLFSGEVAIAAIV